MDPLYVKALADTLGANPTVLHPTGERTKSGVATKAIATQLRHLADRLDKPGVPVPAAER